MCGNQGDSAPLPGFPVTMRDSTLNGWYKFFPQNNDSLTIGVFMYYLGTQVGWGFFQSGIQKLTYTYFSVPIYYSGTFYGTPDSATVFVASFSTNGNYPPNGNSVLYVDNLTFDFVLDAPENLFSSKIMELNTYPNPFAGSVNISYILPESGNVTIKLYDVTGRELKLVYSGNQTTGKYSMLYDAVGLSNGIYQLVIQTKNYKQSRKVVVQK